MEAYRKRELSVICWRFFVAPIPVACGIYFSEYALSMNVQTNRFICTEKDNMVWPGFMHPLLSEEKSPSTTNCMLIKPGITCIWQIPCRFDLSQEGALILGFM